MSTDKESVEAAGAESEQAGSTTESGTEGLLLGADSEQTPTLSVVMPTLNEEDGVAECIDRIKSAVVELGVPSEIVVSDSSTDRTPDIAREMGAVVVEPDGSGYGYAYRYAFERARGEYIAMGDADTTYDFEQIPRLLEPVREGDADMVMGSRLDGEIRAGAMPTLHQYVGNPLLTKFLNAFYDAGVSDAHSGFRVFHRDALAEMDLSTDGMEFASEMIMEAGSRDLTIEEVPIVYHEREGEETLDSFRDGWRHVRFMLLNAPGYLFSVPALGLGVVGTTLCLLALFDISIGQASFGIRTMIAGNLSLLVAFQVGSFGVFSTLASDPIRRQEDAVTEWITDRLTLERGAMLGGVMLVSGLGYVALRVLQWSTEGYGALSSVLPDIFGATVIVLGIQIVFSAFFMSAIAGQSR
ncbi:glycosyltransferase family 2 protein [Halorientalis litorea]|uniref:glycosyltransferase family 2 protein n=1 Tax=Halorientalis litorea TaxID=2931977 RepID=UPI001FF2106F|nr:glycosyltransferase family 2 protein [Halorientalis litorea]